MTDRFRACAHALLTCLVLCAGLSGCASSEAPPAAPRNPVREAAAGLAPASLEALQALRLLGAVQIVRYGSTGSYAHPEELIKVDLLDPEWPRANQEHYRISCEVSPDRENFTCYADAQRQGEPWFRIDDSQRVRVEFSRRPTATSPVFGLPMEGGKP